jgi:hypothetical protein
VNRRAWRDTPWLKNQHASGVGPATSHVGDVYAPDDAGQFLRTIIQPHEVDPRADENAILGTYSALEQASRRLNDPKLKGFLPEDPLVDPTLARSTLEHELGERGHLLGHAPLLGHASHAGIDPHIREQLVLAGRPEASQIVEKLRMSKRQHAAQGDMQLYKLLRQVGHHPDSPIPYGGRQHRTLVRLIQEDPYRLGPDAVRSAINDQRSQDRRWLKMLESFRKVQTPIPRNYQERPRNAMVPAEIMDDILKYTQQEEDFFGSLAERKKQNFFQQVINDFKGMKASGQRRDFFRQIEKATNRKQLQKILAALRTAK